MTIAELTIESTLSQMQRRLRGVVPDIELGYKAELVFEIEQLKRERNAVILGHNYMEPALYHTVPDFVGDSLELSRRAADTDADVIVFCGVRFMAETAKILSPQRTVLLPSPEAGCSLAASITAADVRALKARFPGAPVVAYVNTYTDVKAEADACCTSSNAAAVVRSFDAETIIFVPDEYLARNVARETGRRVALARRAADGIEIDAPTPGNRVRPAGKFGATNLAPRDDARDGAHAPALIAWAGRCEVHEKFTVEDVANVRRQFPDVLVLAHPECSPEVVDAADFSGSTGAMIRRVRESAAPRYLLLTECAMGDNIAAENPDKEMVRLCSVRCPHMNQITLEQTRDALKHMQHVIEVPAALAAKARRAIDAMLAARPG